MPETTEFDHYELLRREDGSLFELGRGAMGITYKAFDTNLRCPVALKVINAASIHSDVARQRFVREARAAALLRHRHVASVFHLGVEGDTYFYAMEFIEGETVESLVRRGGPVQPVLALRIAVQVARALNAAQKHLLVHRDIKPSNLMLVREDEELVVKVIDFGLAKSSRGDEGTGEITLSGGFVGTPHFASPEQLEEVDLDVRSDIYSLGVTLWYMLTGEAPFTGTLAHVMSHHLHSPPPMDRVAFLPEPVRELLTRMLAKKPEQRPRDALELRAELEACIEFLSAAEAAGGAGPAAEIVLAPESGRTDGALVRSKGFYAGALVGSRYELLRELGEITCGWAFHAEDSRNGSKLRLLVLRAEWVGDPAALGQMEREVERLRGVEHPNILRVLGMERTAEASYVLLEWVDGFSLLELLRCRGEIDADEALLLLRQMAAGVEEAMACGLRHLDFSPGQIFVHFPGVEGEPERRLAAPVDRWPEFLVKVNLLCITREFAMSATWMGAQEAAGEFAADSRDSVGARARRCVQSLATVVYEMLGGTPPPAIIGGPGAQAVSRYVPVAALSEAGNAVLRRALDPRDGYASAADFRKAIEGAVAGGYHAQPPASTASGAVLASGGGGVLREGARGAELGVARGSGSEGGVQRRDAETQREKRDSGKDSRIVRTGGAPPPADARLLRLPWLGIAAVSGCALAASGLWFMHRPGPEPETAATAPARPIPVAETVTPVPFLSAASTPASDSSRKAMLREGAGFEVGQDWPQAIESYVEFTRAFPGDDAGQIRLETLLASLRPTLEKMPAGQFAAFRPAVTDAAGQDIVPAMAILAGQIRAGAPADAFAWYCAAGARGDASAMAQAGLMVSNGTGAPQSQVKAAKWFQMAANAGDAEGKTCLAECYLYGTGVKRDERHAIGLLGEAAGAGYARAMNLLGTCLDQGIGGESNSGEAFMLFSRARALGFEDAAGNLGVLYMNGDGVPEDLEKAVELFGEGAQNGSALCMYLLAKCLESGTGIKGDSFKAEAWYRKAAAGGNPMALEWCKSRHVAVERGGR